MQRRDFIRTSAALAGLTLAPRVWAQNPGGNVTIWSGFPSGGLGDQVTRPLIEQLRGKYPQNLVLDSKPGAGGRIAADFVKRAPPDGANLAQCASGTIVLHPHVFRKLPYNTMTDFLPINGVAAFPASLTAGPGLPTQVRTLSDFFRWAKANPEQANIGISSTGSSMHLTAMVLAKHAGVDLRPIPFKGGGPLLTNLMGGQIPISVNVLSEVLPHVRSGRLRSLAVTSPARWKALPEVPTMTELGLKEISYVDWLGWFGPAQLPAARARALNSAVNEALSSPAMAEVFASTGLEPLRESPEGFAALVRRDFEFWGKVVAATGFRPED